MVLQLLLKTVIEEADLDSLIGLPSETDWLDVKEYSYTAKPQGWQQDLCDDISAFANLNGGIIVLGMSQNRQGVIDQLVGLPNVADFDKEILRLKQAGDIGVRPLVPGVRYQAVKLPSVGKPSVIVIQVPRSFAAPHQVEQTKLFKIRRSNGNDAMTVDELRRAFNLTQTYIEQIRAFRIERIATIRVPGTHEELPSEPQPGVKFVLHVVPLAFSDPGSVLDLGTPFGNLTRAPWIAQLGLRGRFNFEGFLCPRGSRTGYTQIYRTGVIEIIELVQPRSIESIPTLGLDLIEAFMVSSAKRSLTILSNLGVQQPIAIMLSLIGVQGIGLVGNVAYADRWDIGNLISRPDVSFPETFVSVDEHDVGKAFRFVFDIAWNMAGEARSANFDAEGNWMEKSSGRA